MSKVRFIYFLLLLLSAPAFSQDATWKNYTIRDGLTHSNVYRIFQDKKGFLWFSTDYAICCFDGHSFKSDFNDPGRLLNTSVLSLSETDRGSKLICTMDGLLEFKDSIVSRYLFTGEKPKVYVYAQERDGSIWLIATYPATSRRRLFEIKDGKLNFHEIRGANGALVEFNTMIACEDEIMLTSSQGLYTVKNNSVQQLFPELVQANMTDAAKDQAGRYWLGLKDRIIVIEHGKKIQEILLPAHKHVNDVFLDKQGQLWIALIEGGLRRIRDGKAEALPGLQAIESVIINDIFQDFEGNIWLATYGSGLYMLNAMNIVNYTSGENIQSIYCKSVNPVNGRVWISSIGKLFELDRGKIEPLRSDQMKSDYYTYFVQQMGRKVYIGTAFGLITKDLDPPYREQKSDSGVISICEDSKGGIWAGSYKSIYLLSGDQPVRHPVSNVIEQRINCMMEDYRGNIWCGTGYGVYIFNPENWQQPGKLLEQLQIIHDIKEDDQHRIWIASNNGLACIDGDSTRIFTKTNGLASNNVNCLLMGKGVLWTGTSGGLNFIDLKTLQLKSLSPVIFKDVILSLCSLGKELFIGTANSVYSIMPDEPEKNDAPPPVFITEVKIAGRKINWPEQLNLPHKGNGLQINYVGVSYQAAHLIEYRYRINGLDQNWHYTSNTLIEIPSLPSGNYVFVLNARKNQGDWSKDVILHISVATPFWKTWWFISIVIVVIATALFLLTRRQILRLESRKRNRLIVYNKMAYLRQQALAALINPHFIFNCMNSIQHFLNSNDQEQANEYLADFAALIRMTLENAQDSFLPLEKEISRIRLYLSLEQLRFEDKLQYTIEVDPAMDLKAIRIPNMILQPYVENAIWHGIMPEENGGHIDIQFAMAHSEQVRIIIRDNGAGIAPGMLHTASGEKQHYGIRLTKQRLQLLKDLSGQHYNISITNLKDTPSGKGTRVEIIVPGFPQEDLLMNPQEDIVFKP